MGAQGQQVGRTFLRLGMTSFGGPVAHLGYFRTELVARRGWLDDAHYADLVALGQFLPGPTSSQVGMGIGLLRAGVPGSIRAWLGFTAPTAVVLIAAGLLVAGGVGLPAGALAGLEVAAVAVVALAVVQMARALARGWVQALLAVATAAAVLAVPTIWMAPVALAVAGALGLVLLPGRVAAEGPGTRTGERGTGEPDLSEMRVPGLPRWAPTLALATFGALLVGLPLVARAWPGEWTVLIAGFYRAGALVFGGGHVVLPLLQDVAVPTGYVSQEAFLAGYGLANAMPGPLFAFAGFLGAAAGGVWLGLASVVAIFTPALLLVIGVLGHWHRVRANPDLRRALAAVNAAVVGLLAAALWDPVIRTGITGWPTALMATLALLALWRLRAPAHLVVLACGLLGWLVL